MADSKPHITFAEFMSQYRWKKIYLGSTMDLTKDVFEVGRDYSLAHCVSADLEMSKGIATIFKRRFGGEDELMKQHPRIGKVLYLERSDRFIFYLIPKRKYYHTPTYEDMWVTLLRLKKVMKRLNVTKLAVPRLGSGLDKLPWTVVHNMLEIIFHKSGFRIVICHYVMKSQARCMEYRMGDCVRGDKCKFRHW